MKQRTDGRWEKAKRLSGKVVHFYSIIKVNIIAFVFLGAFYYGLPYPFFKTYVIHFSKSLQK